MANSKRAIIASSIAVVIVVGIRFVQSSENDSVGSETAFIQSSTPTFEVLKHDEAETLLTISNHQDRKIDIVMTDALDELNLQFGAFLNGEQANEYLVQAFYTNDRWQSFYEMLGYKKDEIEQLLSSRNQYLADVSQSGKKYYYQRWSTPPHTILSDAIAYGVVAFLDNGVVSDVALENALSDVAQTYGVSYELVECVARSYLLSSITEIETITALNPQTDSISVSKDFIGFLESDKFLKN
ncbi:hypothetical protein NTH44_003163 [Vibrio metoecus]